MGHRRGQVFVKGNLGGAIDPRRGWQITGGFTIGAHLPIVWEISEGGQFGDLKPRE